MREFASGVLLAPNHTAQVTVGLARLAEELGYGSVWVADEGTKTRDVFVTMTAIATATQSVRIGTGLVNPYTRHPALTAAAIASIDELSGGRAFLVYGAGGSLSLGPLGIERQKPLVHVREALEVCRRLRLETPVPIIVLSQLSRAPETRSDHRPQLSDLRESGALEQDADLVVLIYRDDVYNRSEEHTSVLQSRGLISYAVF